MLVAVVTLVVTLLYVVNAAMHGASGASRNDDWAYLRVVFRFVEIEQAGWVRRETCPTDRRGSFARLTDDGFAALADAAPAHVESVRRHLIDRLTPEQVRQLQ